MDLGIAERSCHAHGRVGNTKFGHGTAPTSCNAPTDVAKSRAIHDKEKFGSECVFLIPNGKPKLRQGWPVGQKGARIWCHGLRKNIGAAASGEGDRQIQDNGEGWLEEEPWTVVDDGNPPPTRPARMLGMWPAERVGSHPCQRPSRQGAFHDIFSAPWKRRNDSRRR